MSKTRTIITWVLTALLALAYLGAGYLMVSGQAAIVQEFTDFGLPGWIRVTIGALEMTGAVLLLIPAFTGTAPNALSIILVGGTACHLMFTSPPQAIPPVLFFSILTYIYLTRKNIVPVCLQKQLIG